VRTELERPFDCACDRRDRPGRRCGSSHAVGAQFGDEQVTVRRELDVGRLGQRRPRCRAAGPGRRVATVTGNDANTAAHDLDDPVVDDGVELAARGKRHAVHPAEGGVSGLLAGGVEARSAVAGDHEPPAGSRVDANHAAAALAPSATTSITLVSIHGPATPTRLELESSLPATTLRERLQSLQSAGYVQRIPNPSDGRSHFVVVTPEGKTFLQRVAPAIARVEEQMSDLLGEPVEALRPHIERLRRAGQAVLAEDSAGFGEEGPATAVVFR